MSLESKYKKLAQSLINKRGASLQVDGIIGRDTNRIFFQLYKSDLSGDRLCAYVVQYESIINDKVDRVKLDGWWGPNTEDVADRLIDGNVYLKREDEGSEKSSPFTKCWNPSDRRFIDTYGNPGANQGMCHLPSGIVLRLDWDLDTTVTKFTCHETLIDEFAKGYEMVADKIGLVKMKSMGLDRFGGVFNKRKKRGGSTWSTHAFGAAMDTFPSRNKLKWKKDRALFARSDYNFWFNIWESLGFMSLGRCYGFDWQHIQRNP